jgi:hypothetical protein
MPADLIQEIPDRGSGIAPLYRRPARQRVALRNNLLENPPETKLVDEPD